jgi:hypothetical protein
MVSNKRAAQLAHSRAQKRQRPYLPNVADSQSFSNVGVDVEGLSVDQSSDDDDDDVEVTDDESDLPQVDPDALAILMQSASAMSASVENEQVLSIRQQRRRRAAQRDLEEAARRDSQPITNFWPAARPSPSASTAAQAPTPAEAAEETPSPAPSPAYSPTPSSSRRRRATSKDREIAVVDLKNHIARSHKNWTAAALTRHYAVYSLLRRTENRKEAETRLDVAMDVARNYGKGVYFARAVVSWENAWIASRTIPQGEQGRHGKTSSWFNDEGVMLAVREWLAEAGDSG